MAKRMSRILFQPSTQLNLLLMTPVLFAARERVIGWYHTGPRLRESDLDIHGLLGNYCSNPLLLICEVQVRSSRCMVWGSMVPGRCICSTVSFAACPLQPKEVGLPVHAYVAEDEVSKDGTQRATKVFVNLPTVVGSTEAEQIGTLGRERRERGDMRLTRLPRRHLIFCQHLCSLTPFFLVHRRGAPAAGRQGRDRGHALLGDWRRGARSPGPQIATA